MTLHLKAETEDAGARLDAFVASHANGLTRSQAARYIDEGRVAVDGKPASKSCRIGGGETVTVDVPEVQDTARQAVEDMAQRMVSIIVISGIDVSGVNHDGWYDTLTTARQAGIPVALLNPIATPTDSTLFAATLTINDRMTDATPLADAVAGIANNDPHDRTILVTTISHGGKQ